MRRWLRRTKRQAAFTVDDGHVTPNNRSGKPLSTNMDENLEPLRALYSGSYGVVFRPFHFGQHIRAELIFIEGLADTKETDDHVLSPLLSAKDLELEKVHHFIQRAIPIGGTKVLRTVSECTQHIANGNPVLFIDGVDQAIGLSLQNAEKRSVEEPSTEPAIRGPKDGFVESLQTNTSLLRLKIRSSDLKMQSLNIGSKTNTDIVITYMDGIADPTLIEELNARLGRIDIDGILDSGYIEEMIEDDPYSPFPQCKNTERADVTAAHLLEGGVAVLVNGSPTAILMPTDLIALLQAADDYYNRFVYSSTLRLLRIIMAFLSLVLPSVYVAVIIYHREAIPTGLLTSIAASREEVPFPTVGETLMMLVAFEVLREAGLRLPKQVGGAVTIVGALVIGDAAVNAGFVSAPIVIIIAFMGIATFTIPNYSLELAVRILRVILVLLGGTLGLLGVMLGIIAIAIHLCTLRSFGVPYLKPFAPLQWKEWRDALIRAPWWKMDSRPHFTGKWNKKREANRQKPGPSRN